MPRQRKAPLATPAAPLVVAPRTALLVERLQVLHTEARRLAVLEVLHAAPTYRCNARVIADLLDQLGLPVSQDQLAMDLSWLQESGLITLVQSPGTLVARATQRGDECARGVIGIPGVARPPPAAT